MAESESKCESKGGISRKVLIALDGSEHSDRALQWYLKTMLRTGDNVILFHAFEIPPLPYSSGPFVFSFYEEWREMVKQSREACEMMLRSYEEQIKNLEEYKTKRIHYEIILMVGKPAGDVICQVVKNDDIDIIVIGSRGNGVLRRTLLGSVTDYVVHHAHIPVCVSPRPAQ